MLRFLLNKQSLLILPLIFFSLFSFSQKIILEGNYLGENIYVQNPFAGSGTGFCVTKVLVNGKETNDTTNASAFEINLAKYNFKLGDKIRIEILHKPDCKPKVLNPQIAHKNNFEITSMKIDKEGWLVWTTKNAEDTFPFIIEQYRWNKWIKIGEMQMNQDSTNNIYKFKITTFHSGENQFRIKQLDSLGIMGPHYAKPVKWINGEIAKKPWVVKEKKIIYFDKETMFEIYDAGGNIITKGTGKEIDCSAMYKGVYYLNFDNSTAEFLINGKSEIKSKFFD